MTTAAAGSAAASGNPSGSAAAGSGNPNGASGSGGGGSSNGASDFLSVLSEDNRKVAEAKGWTAPDKLNGVFDGYRGLESKLGSEPRMPSATADQTELDKAFRHLGWPEKPEGYEFKMPSGLPDNFPYDKGFADTFKTWAHEARLTPAQTQLMHDKYVTGYASDVIARQKEVNAHVTATKEWMIKTWGNETDEPYRQSSEAARRAIVALEAKPEFKGLRNELIASGLILAGEGDHFTPANPALMELLAHYGRTHSMEHGYTEGSKSGGPAGNPFAKDTLNITAQAQIIRKDPVEARRLIVAAGEDPTGWGL